MSASAAPGRAGPDAAGPSGSALAGLAIVRATGVLDRAVVDDLDPVLATTLRLARDEGVALSPVVDAAVRSTEQQRRLAGEVETAIAPARAVSRSLMALPLLAVPILGAIAGVDLVGFYVHDPVGRVVGMVVALLLAIALGWMRLLIVAPSERLVMPAAHRRRSVALGVVGTVVALVGPTWIGLGLAGLACWRWWRPPAPPVSALVAVVADLAAVGLAAGHDLPTALRVAADHLARGVRHDDVDVVVAAVRTLALDLVLRPDQGAPVHDPVRSPAGDLVTDPVLGPLPDVVRALVAAGAPGVDALRALARRLREERAAEARQTAARLPTRLTFPTALVLVPATVLAIGAPIVLQGLDGLTGT